jgi:hypothetical protein
MRFLLIQDTKTSNVKGGLNSHSLKRGFESTTHKDITVSIWGPGEPSYTSIPLENILKNTDVVIILEQYDLSWIPIQPLIQSTNLIKAVWYGGYYENIEQYKNFCNAVKCQVVYCTNNSITHIFNKESRLSLWLPFCVEEKYKVRPKLQKRDFEIGCIINDEFVTNDLNRILKEYNVDIIPKKELTPTRVFNTIRKYKILLELNNSLSFSNIMFHAIHNKILYITNYVEDIQGIFNTLTQIILFHSYDDLQEKLMYYLYSEQERNNVTEESYTTLLQSHTYKHRGDFLYKHLNTIIFKS